LIWTGHVTMFGWLGIAVAMLASRPGPFGPGAWTRVPHRAPRVAAAVACALYIGSAWWLGDILPGGDEPNYLLITQNLLKDGDLKIENNHASRAYSEYFRGNLALYYLRRGPTGQTDSV